MLNFIRRALAKGDHDEIPQRQQPKTEKFVYGRPYFLGLSKEEVDNSRDFGMRPIFIPRNKDKAHKIPFNAGYAECINGGKSDFNEDNSYACILSIKGVKVSAATDFDQLGPYNSPVWPDNASEPKVTEPHNAKKWLYLEAVYFGVFDGHAGYHTSLIVSRLLHKHLQEKLEACLGHLIHKMDHPIPTEEDFYNTDISIDDLVIGALEDSFAEMDAQLDRESSSYRIKGGCTALVALFLNDKLYVANAGDCRAVLGQGDNVQAVSRDFNPESERQRLNLLGHCYPELLHNEFSCMEFTRRLNKHDLGKRVLCRKPGMEGWVTKIVTEEDLRFPIVTGEGRKARLMGTIGVTRGLGDFTLRVYDTDVWIKPFLSSKPEVRIIDLSSRAWTEEDVLIIGSDGLWDGVTNEEAMALVRQAIQPNQGEDKDISQRYTIAAQELVCEARGSFTGRGWRKKNDDQGSFDDITAFVIPIKPAVDKWKNRSNFVKKITISKQDSQASTSSNEMVASGCSDDIGKELVCKTASLPDNQPARATKVGQTRHFSAIDQGRSTIKKRITTIDANDKTKEKRCEKIDVDDEDDKFEVIETTDAAIADVMGPGSVINHEGSDSRRKTSTEDKNLSMPQSDSLDTRISSSGQAEIHEHGDSTAKDNDQESGAIEIYKLNPGEDDSSK